jgi:hypothetical protein
VLLLPFDQPRLNAPPRFTAAVSDIVHFFDGFHVAPPDVSFAPHRQRRVPARVGRSSTRSRFVHVELLKTNGRASGEAIVCAAASSSDATACLALQS